MIQLQNFRYVPGGENESGTAPSDSNEDKKDNSAAAEAINEKKEAKPMIEKIREALRDWSNKDEADLEFDDTRV